MHEHEKKLRRTANMWFGRGVAMAKWIIKTIDEYRATQKQQDKEIDRLREVVDNITCDVCDAIIPTETPGSRGSYPCGECTDSDMTLIHKSALTFYRKNHHIVTAINELRSGEGDIIVLLCDNPDGPPNNAVQAAGFWTGYELRRFEGETLIEALEKAVAAKAKAPNTVTGTPPAIDGRILADAPEAMS